MNSMACPGNKSQGGRGKAGLERLFGWRGGCEGVLKCVIRGRKTSRWGRRDGGGEGVQRKEHLSGG